MRCLISYHGEGYKLRGLEYLAEVLHPMAAVAWDRDCSEVELSVPDDMEWIAVDIPAELSALRFSIYNEICVARTGSIGRIVAKWDAARECWVVL